MPLRLLHYERGYLPEPLGLLHSSSFPHIAILRAGYDVWHSRTGFQVLAWEAGGSGQGLEWGTPGEAAICGCEEIPEVSKRVSICRSKSELRGCGADAHHDGKWLPVRDLEFSTGTSVSRGKSVLGFLTLGQHDRTSGQVGASQQVMPSRNVLCMFCQVTLCACACVSDARMSMPPEACIET